MFKRNIAYIYIYNVRDSNRIIPDDVKKMINREMHF